jgi:1,4-dihydroxy-2-naphthoate octaprenyltransferase
MADTSRVAPPGEPHPARLTSPLGRYLLATRPAFLSLTLIGCLVGLATAAGSGLAIDAGKAVLTIMLAVLAQAGANVLNDYYDAASGADVANRERLFPFTGGSRFIQNGVLSPGQTRAFGFALLAAVIPAGLWLAWQAGAGLVAIGMAGLCLGWAYSAPPFALMSRGLGEVAIALCWLLVTVGTDYVQRGSFSALPALAGLSYALLVANVLYLNQFPDRAGDAAAGKRTLVVRLGPQVAKWGYLLIAILAHGWLLAMVARYALPQHAAAAALSVVLSFSAARELIAHAGEPAELRPAILRTLLAAHLHGLLLAAALAFGRWPAGA